MDKYAYKLLWSEEDQEWVGLCVEFPGLSWLDEAPQEALAGIQNLVNDIITDMKKNGETIPIPFSLKKFSGKFMVRIPPEQHRALSIKAAEEGISLNRLASSMLLG